MKCVKKNGENMKRKPGVWRWHQRHRLAYQRKWRLSWRSGNKYRKRHHGGVAKLISMASRKYQRRRRQLKHGNVA
jgi:hypothetical protein